MPGKHLVIVESPTKAKTIRKFLPAEYLVTSSMGHVRDLPQSATEIPAKVKGKPWANLGVNVEEHYEPLYVVPSKKRAIIRELQKDLKQADDLYLATDEDREGESISWHLVEVLKPTVPIKRMVFHEITREAIEQALQETRDIDAKLVRAQETRRILDRLVGYTLSPLLWKKIAYGLSAGRVQSVALKLIVDRERSRMTFRAATYGGLTAKLAKGADAFEARLAALPEGRLATGKDFDDATGALIAGRSAVVLTAARAQELATKLTKASWTVKTVEEKPLLSRPAPPFITSSLQQESNRKLGLSSAETMRTAQRLYEEGLITYMRTDSPQLSAEGIAGARAAVEQRFGSSYLSEHVRQFSAKSKIAQEAHEAIRPAGQAFVDPEKSGLSGKDQALYELIWKRTLASQMAEAKKQSMTVHIDVEAATFVATGIRILFPGFLRVYVEGADDPETQLGDTEVPLPPLAAGDALALQHLTPTEHVTKPPARFTEATLVRTLEEEGIGRPSTYASIISTILDRGYVRKVHNALVPTFTAFGVTQLLERHFAQLVDTQFTSTMEQALDEIATGKRDWQPYLDGFYRGPEGLEGQVAQRAEEIDPTESRTIRLPQVKDVQVRIGRYGAYLVKNGNGDANSEDTHASIPEDIAPGDLRQHDIEDLITLQERGPEPIGTYPETGQPIYCLSGRYGPYVQVGEAAEGGPKPKRASLPRGLAPRDLTLELALKLLSIPRTLGTHPETKKEIVANIGRFGPYVVHDGDFRSLTKDDDVYTVTLERALELLAQEKKSRRGGGKVLRELGSHPKEGKPVRIYEGRFGPYVKYGSVNASLPRGLAPEDATMEDALALIHDRAKRGKKIRR
ncbi:MAG: type I DNA topoisomerase [Candidatus Kerfeldbacteria bacterium]|nr:type I DNA topoisomerase [Candidatus Kerfeldbacteria bacterium]